MFTTTHLMETFRGLMDIKSPVTVFTKVPMPNNTSPPRKYFLSIHFNIILCKILDVSPSVVPNRFILISFTPATRSVHLILTIFGKSTNSTALFYARFFAKLRQYVYFL